MAYYIIYFGAQLPPVFKILETKQPATLVQPFLQAMFSHAKIQAMCNHIDFVDDSLHCWLGDLVTPGRLWRLLKNSGEFKPRFEGCIRACMSRWEANQPHPDEDKYLILMKQAMPKIETKQTELF